MSLLGHTKHRLPDRLETEKNIPYPPRAEPVVDRFKFGNLDPGDSFLIPYPKLADRRQRKYIQMLAGAAVATANARLPERQFSQRSNENGVRIWRIR